MNRRRDMTRRNERIRAPRVRLLGPTGEQLGIMSSRQAVAKAKSMGLDLVEIAAKADPPVCKIVDYGKWKYEQAKLKKGQKTKSVTRLKEIKLRVRTEAHDYNIKLARAEKFLDEGHKVRVQLQFRGRENAHREIGFEVMRRAIDDLSTMAHVDQQPRLSGRAINMVLSPLPEQQRKPKFNHIDADEEIYESDDDAPESDETPETGAPDESVHAQPESEDRKPEPLPEETPEH
jgi:translation initiation factor IF-3